SPTRGWPATSGGQHRQAPRRRAEDSSEALGNSAEALGNSGRGDRCTGAQTDPGNGASVTFSVSITFSTGALRPTTSRSAASRELTTFALVRWRSAYVPLGKAESARALPSRIRLLRHRRKHSQKPSGINCVAATIQLTSWEPATFDCPVDRRFGNACGPCCAAWCVHGALPMHCAKNLLLSFTCFVKDRLSYAAEQRRKGSIVIPSGPSTDPRSAVAHH